MVIPRSPTTLGGEYLGGLEVNITVRRQDLKVAKKGKEEYLKNPQVHKWPSDSGDLRCSRQDLYFCRGGRG